MARLQVPDSLRDKVLAVGSEVTSEDVDLYRGLQEIENRSAKLQAVLDAWSTQQSDERKMRTVFSSCILVGVGVQVVAANVAFFMLGSGVLVVQPWTADIFFVAVFSELAAMTWLVLRYLFKDTGAQALDLIERI